MEALINSWRKLWNNKTMPFYYVQIAPYYYTKAKGPVTYTEFTEPELREAQTMALQIPHTGMIVTTDLNDDIKNIHPPFKWEVGRRLELQALANTYGKKGVVFSGPMYQKMKIKGGKIILHFKYTDGGLVSHDGKPLNYFTIAGNDGKFVGATAVIKRNQIQVSSPSIASPVAVRFAWTESAQPNFFNKDGLPAVPFRTDNPLKFTLTDN
jgi:sialate O-acetylesterase